MDERAYWLGFHMISGVGPARFRLLLQAFETLEEAWHAPAEALRQAGLDRRTVERITAARGCLDIEAELLRLEALGITVLTWSDPSYPRLLHAVDSAPPVLFMLGELTPADEWALAVVGTRYATGYGREVTRRLVMPLAEMGVTIVSGLALGIDGEAHRAALDAGGRTIAVLACGLDQIYPPEHRRLAQEITAHGALLSEYPLGTLPERRNFPPRNRLISGLARATLVVEAGSQSGALITARFAAEQGRDVFAVPGSILSPRQMGTNWLIQEGAIPVMSYEDIVRSLQVEMLPAKQEAQRSLDISPAESTLLACLGEEPLHIDELGRRSGLPIDVVSSTLTIMELKGMVRQMGGMQYISTISVPPGRTAGSSKPLRE
ncbi:MAG: DNA-processing protein DprA [Anaerolineae bacterium]